MLETGVTTQRAWDTLVMEHIPAFALQLKKADDVRQRKLQAAQNRKILSAAKRAGSGGLRRNVMLSAVESSGCLLYTSPSPRDRG